MFDSGPKKYSESEEEKRLAYIREGQKVFALRYGNDIALSVTDKSRLNTYLIDWHNAFLHGQPQLPLPTLIDNFVQMYHSETKIPETPLIETELQECIDEYGLLFVAQQVQKITSGNMRMENHMVHQKMQQLYAYTEGIADGDTVLIEMMKKQESIDRVQNAIKWIAVYNGWSKRTLQNALYGARQKTEPAENQK